MFASRGLGAYAEQLAERIEAQRGQATQAAEPQTDPAPASAQVQDAVASAVETRIDDAELPSEVQLGSPTAAPQPVDPGTRGLTRVFRSLRNLQSEFGKKLVGRQPGTAGSSVLTADSRVKINEASMSVTVLRNMYRQGSSGLREMMAGMVDDPPRMINDDKYADRMIMKFFRRNNIKGVCEKSPTTNESDAHVRVIRAHRGPGARIHPIVHAMWNADFDGDTMRISFDQAAIAGSKTAMDFLIGTDGANKIDPGFFGLAVWRSTDEATVDIINKLFKKLGISAEEAQHLADAIDMAADGNEDEGFRSMLRWTREIANRIGGANRDDMAAKILSDIWKMNTLIRLAGLDLQVMWDYTGPMIKNAAFDMAEAGLDPEFEHMIVEGTAPSSINAYSVATGGPIGFVEGRNVHFRFIAGLTKIVKVHEAEMFESPRRGAITSETWIANQMSGLAAFEDSGRGVANDARRRVLEMAKRPDTSSDKAFERWLFDAFMPSYNFVAISVNAAVANWSLAGTIVGYEKLSIPFIPEVLDTTNQAQLKKQRDEIRSQFLKIYGRFTMGYLFGNQCPKGWEDVRLHEYVTRQNETKKFLGDGETDYSKITNFIGRLADLRTSFPKTFDERLMGSSSEGRTPDEAQKQHQKEGILELMMARDKKGRMLPKTMFARMVERHEAARAAGLPDVFEQDLNDLAEVFVLLGKDMFYFLGLHNPLAFMQTGLGQKFKDAKSPQELGGVLYEAIARYRFEPVRIADRQLELAQEKNDTAKIEAAIEAKEAALTELASSSDTWAAIVAAYRDPSLLSSVFGDKWEGKDVFRDILFADMSKATKDQRINTLVLENPTLRLVHNQWEVAYGLFANPRGIYDGMRFTDDLGHTTLLDALKDATNKVNRYAKANYDTAVKDVSKAYKKFGKKPQTEGSLTAFLTAVREDPSVLVRFDRHVLVDAAIGGMEASFAYGEKAQQEYQASVVYQLASYIRNGGTFSDVLVGGDLALGFMPKDKFESSPLLVAKALTDPDFEIDVYDEYGVSQTMSMMTIFGSNEVEEADMWTWLQRHPRAAEALRMNTVRNTINNKTGFSYNIATSTLPETIEGYLDANMEIAEEERCIKALADHPGFYGLITLLVPQTGKKRIQVRSEILDESRISKLIGLLRGLDSYAGNTLEFVEEVARAQGMPWDDIESVYRRGEESRLGRPWDEISEALANGEKLKPGPGTKSISDAPLSDPRFIEHYQTGQVLHRIADDLERYRLVLKDAGLGAFDGNDAASPSEAAEILFLSDAESLRSYLRAVNELSGSKTAQSTSVNGAMSKLLGGLMAIARHTPDRCAALDPDPIGLNDFMANWRGYVGRRVWIKESATRPEYWIPVNEVTVSRIEELSRRAQKREGGLYVYLESTDACTDQLCPCVRHATADPSTHFGKNQSAAIGRFLTVIRSLSTEGLNLKVATVGDDGTDSITKFDVFKIMREADAKKRIQEAYDDPALGEDVMARTAAARRMLASIMANVYSGELKYNKGELSIDDYINVAQILVRPVYSRSETGEPVEQVGIRVISIGQASAIINGAMNADGRGELDMEEFVELAREALHRADLVGSLGVETVLAGVRISRKMPYHPGIVDTRMSATERSVDEMYKIQRAVAARTEDGEIDLKKVRTQGDYELDEKSHRLRRNPKYASLVEKWSDVFVEDSEGDLVNPWKWGDQRYKSRLTGVVTGDSFNILSAIGPRNSWIIDANSPKFVEAMLAAYKYGVNILLEGTPTHEQWDRVREESDGLLDQNQGRMVRQDGAKIGPFISTFDIRLNGANSVIRGGAHDAGVFHALPKFISFFFESIANEFGLSDAEFLASESWVKDIVFKQTGDYAVKAQIAFGDLLSRANELDYRLVSQQRTPRVELVPLPEIIENVVERLMSTDPDVFLPIDVGKVITPGSAEAIELDEAIDRYLSRVGDIDPDTGLIMNAKPGEIIGWMVATWGDDVQYHPIRLYENANSSGAPAEFMITGMPVFNQDTQELLLEWENAGTLESRTFKLFEDIYSADKFMGRAVPMKDIKLATGRLVAGMIARASTASRRLFQRKPQLMTTLMYMARMEPFGYNIATDEAVLPNNPELKSRLLSGDATIDEWIKAFDDVRNPDGSDGVLEIFEDDEDMNSFANFTAREAIRFNICPTVVFASHYTRDGVTKPSNLWYNFSVLFSGEEHYQGQLMKFLNRQMPKLCPPGVEDIDTPEAAGGTLFNNNLQVLVPVRYRDENGRLVTKKTWVDMFGGFHFFDEHFTGASNSGARVNTNGLPAEWARLPGRDLSRGTVTAYRMWFGGIDPNAFPNHAVTLRSVEDDLGNYQDEYDSQAGDD